MTIFIIALAITYFCIFLCKGEEWLLRENRKQRTRVLAEELCRKDNYTFFNNAIDNRGYEPYDGLVQYKNGVYNTIIFGNEDFPITRYLKADSIEELQKLADPFLEERREAWLKRNKRKRR